MKVIGIADQPRFSRNEQAYREKQRVNLVSVIVNLIMAVAKLVFGMIGQSQASQSIERVNLHYLDGKIYVELLLPLSVAEDKSGLESIANQFSQALVGRDEVADVKVCFH